jgi:uncharacterized membrane protein YgdD (TMEM256/DUF423 family)
VKEDNLLWVLLFLGGVFGGTAVLLSAWGAHALEDLFITSPQDRFSFNYATNFQLFHALLLVSLALCMISSGSRSILLLASSVFLILGILLFSFPIYGRMIWGYSELSRLTPIGGICFFLAWCLISLLSISKIIHICKDRSKSEL